MYQFTWPGKRAARYEAAEPIDDTLRPVPADSVDWDTTENLYIEGDNLRVLKLLQRGYMGKVKMIILTHLTIGATTLSIMTTSHTLPKKKTSLLVT